MKAVLIMDMPANCLRCRFLSKSVHSINGNRYCKLDAVEPIVSGDYKIEFKEMDKRADFCPLIAIPERRDVRTYGTGERGYYEARGFNACLDEVTGENHE